jgi:hypothetical protein
MAAGLKPSQEFRFYNVERAESGVARLRVRHRRESIDRCLAAVLGGAESVRVGALGCEPVGIDDAAVLGRLGSQSDGTFREPPIFSQRQHTPIFSQRQHTPIFSQRQHAPIKSEREFTTIVGGKWRQPFGRVTKLQPAQFVRRKRIQRRRRRRFVNASGELSRINESRRRRRRPRGWRPTLSWMK